MSKQGNRKIVMGLPGSRGKMKRGPEGGDGAEELLLLPKVGAKGIVGSG
jgi:hypothetical protein